MTLYDQIYDEVRDHLNEADASLLAECLSRMPAASARALFSMVDNYEPSEAEQGLTPIPRGYAEQ